MTLARTLRPLASRHPQTVRIAGSFDLGAAAVAATLDMSTVNAQMDNVFVATAAGAAGNNITVTMVGDSPPAGGVTINRAGTDFTIHFESGVSTQGDVNTAVTALAGADDLFGVQAAGTVATLLVHGRSLLDMDTDWGDPDTIVRAGFLTGAAGDGYQIATVADGLGGGAGTLEVLTVGGGLQLLYHFQDGVTTVLDFETALAALTPADFEVDTAGTPADTFAAATDQVVRNLAAGSAVHAENAAASFSGGSDPVAPTSWRGMRECTGITHPSVGLYVISFRDAYPVLLALQATLQLGVAAGLHAQIGPGVTGGTVQVRVLDLTTGALTDPVPGAGDRINVMGLAANTRMGRISTL